MSLATYDSSYAYLGRTMLSALRGLQPLNKLVVAGTTTVFVLVVLLQRLYLRRFSRFTRQLHTEDDAKVSFSVLKNFRQIAKIALPTWRCKEVAGMLLFMLLFLVKAVLRVQLSKANGRVLDTMLHGKPSSRLYRFVQRISIRAALGMAAGICSGTIEGLRPWLIACFRRRLSQTFQRRFYKHLIFYQATVLDNRLEAVDTAIATYCGEFAEHFAELPYYFVLPGLECAMSSYALTKQSGRRAASIMGVVVTLSVLLLRKLSPQFGRIHALLLMREDDYRRMLTSSLYNVENIAMYGGGDYTRRRLDQSLTRLKRTLDHMALAKASYETLETVFSAFLSIVASMVAFDGARRSYFRRPVSDLYLEINLIEGLNTSVKDFVVNFRELSHLSEFSNKMAEFDTTLKSIAAGTFMRGKNNVTTTIASRSESDEAGSPVQAGSPLTLNPMHYTTIQITQCPVKGGCEDSAVHDLVRLEDVTLNSPAGHLLLQQLTLAIRSNEDWVITGENGSGKTSLLRMLAGLWLPSNGVVSLASCVRLLFAPQHSYMVPQCTLFEQIAFPYPPPEPTPEVQQYVCKAIELAGAQTVLDVIGGVESAIMGFDKDNHDESYDWSSLSGGQKQRISMARIFFHALRIDRRCVTPIAVLDEATSMMDESEQDVLNHLRRMNVRMISVTHRDVVIRHHTHVLRLRPNGQWLAERVTNTVEVGKRVETSTPSSVQMDSLAYPNKAG